jgi:hypothetical protein
MANFPTPRGLQLFGGLLEIFSPEARASRLRRWPRRKVGATLRVGPTTPLWNQLVVEVRPFLKKRGEKAQLARILGVHRQAVNEYFVSRRRMPDAERTLLLVQWLVGRRTDVRLV